MNLLKGIACVIGAALTTFGIGFYAGYFSGLYAGEQSTIEQRAALSSNTTGEGTHGRQLRNPRR